MLYLENYLIQKIKDQIKPDSSELLEIGCGNGRFGKLLSKYFLKYYGIDKNIGLIKKVEKLNVGNLEYQYGEAENIPFNKKFDIIFFSLSWHMIENKDSVLNELKRVIKEKGIILVLEPSKYTTNWASSKLKMDSPDFNEKLLTKKLEELEKAEKFLKKQNLFKIILEDYNEKTTLKLFILK